MAPGVGSLVGERGAAAMAQHDCAAGTTPTEALQAKLPTKDEFALLNKVTPHLEQIPMDFTHSLRA